MDENNSFGNTPKQTKKNSHKVFLVFAVLGLLLLGGLVYSNIAIMKTKQEVSELASRTESLEAASEKGAIDELLGFDKVDADGYQAVFLNGGSSYFGKITEMTTENFTLEKVYYLRINEAGGDQQDTSLVKLGCELHKPEDKMTIIRSNVLFWENLKDNDPQSVAQAINTYEASYPNGQECIN